MHVVYPFFCGEPVTSAEIASLTTASDPLPVYRTNGRSGYLQGRFEEVDAGGV